MIDQKQLEEMVAQKYISVQKHPEEELFIYNYTQSCQFEKMWNETTMMCRGLILNQHGDVIARPFKKFFNVQEHEVLPLGDFKVFEKMDGSLGILYWIGGIRPCIATRGSFVSDQAKWATAYCQSKNLHPCQQDQSITHLFEIIFPENRIVCDYGDKKALVHLAAIDTKTGLDVDIKPEQIEHVKEYHGITDYKELISQHRDNAEGYVLRWDSGFRVKIKHAEYVRLHRLITGFSTRTLWEYLALEDCRKIWNDAKVLGVRLKLNEVEVAEMISKEGPILDALIEKIPDELFGWMQSTRADYDNRYKEIEEEIRAIFCREKINLLSRRDAGLLIDSQYKKYSSALFNILDNRPYNNIIWNMIYPTQVKCFKYISEAVA